jgi:hypothetical protein
VAGVGPHQPGIIAFGQHDDFDFMSF